MSIHSGLVSISFRKLTSEQIIALAAEAGLRGIEWGGDIHCPHGDVARAQAVGEATRRAGLTVAAYGSYYRIGVSEQEGLTFVSVLESAVALGAPRIRVWVGNRGSADCPPQQRLAIIADAQRIATLAAERNIRVVSEWHGGTLTDHAASGVDFLRAVGHPNFTTVWQPSVGLDTDAALAELTAALPWVEHLHVFHWQMHDRRPLAEGADRWRRYLACAAATGRPLTAALEFVLGDEPQQLVRDAATLNTLLAELA
jgi:sugar phosphate isomerase/epimerase